MKKYTETTMLRIKNQNLKKQQLLMQELVNQKRQSLGLLESDYSMLQRRLIEVTDILKRKIDHLNEDERYVLRHGAKT